MRTTMRIDDDVLRAVRRLASRRGQTLGETLAEPARASLTRSAAGAYRNGVKLLPINLRAYGATLEEVNALWDAFE